MSYKVDNIKNYSKTKGWICGQFFPKNSIQKNSDLEVNFRTFMPGDTVKEHYHPFGREVTIITKGKIKMLLNNKEFLLKEEDFIYLENNIHETITEVLKPTTVISVRTPSIPNNKINIH